MKTSNPLRWHGGKFFLAKRIIELMPPHTRYAEPFFGGGAVLFAKNPEGVSEFINDLDSELMNFWMCLQCEERFHSLVRKLQVTPLCQPYFDFVKDLEKNKWPNGDADCHPSTTRAYHFFIRYRQSRQGLGKDYCTPTRRTRRGMNENVSAWMSAVEGLPEAHQRLMRVEIWNKDALEFIKKLDTPDTLYYCDPSYLHETRSSTGEYKHEMTEDQHRQLLTTLGNIEGKFILSGYPSAMYDQAAEEYGWNRVEIEIDNKASSAKVKEKKTEILWTNY